MYDDGTRRDGASSLLFSAEQIDAMRAVTLGSRDGMDRHTFIAGYQAAMEDMNGPCTMERTTIMFADSFSAASRAYDAQGKDWLTPLVNEREEARRWERRPVRTAPKPAPAGTIYVLSDGNGEVKIGWTGGDADVRRRSVEKASGRSLTVIATTPGSKVAERGFHERFAADCTHGEWFTRSPAIDAWIETL